MFTVFAHALADVIQRAHRKCKKQTCCWYSDHFICSMLTSSVLFFFITEWKILIILVFYYKGMLDKVTMQRTVSVVTKRSQLNAVYV